MLTYTIVLSSEVLRGSRTYLIKAASFDEAIAEAQTRLAREEDDYFTLVQCSPRGIAFRTESYAVRGMWG